EERQMERARAAVQRDAVSRLAVSGERLLEAGDLLPEDERRLPAHPVDGAQDLVAQLGVLRRQIEIGNPHVGRFATYRNASGRKPGTRPGAPGATRAGGPRGPDQARALLATPATTDGFLPSAARVTSTTLSGVAPGCGVSPATAWNSVSTGPGETTRTSTPEPWFSAHSASPNMRSKALVAP